MFKDWICAACSYSNYQRNTKCKRCQKDKKTGTEVESDNERKAGDTSAPKRQKPNEVEQTPSSEKKEEQTAEERKTNDWQCASCLYMNFKRNTNCKQCNKVKETSTTATIATTTTISSPPTPKPQNTWNCICGCTNFAFRSTCFQCHTERPLAEGEWRCQSCKLLIFAFKPKCFSCGITRGDAEREQNKESTSTTDDEERGNCSVCLTEKANTVLLNCGHVCLCLLCVYKLNKCPLCRVDFSPEQIRQVYLN